jgi:uncharacterized damage-inducible protein DinB
MSLKSHLRQALVSTREFSERLLQAFHTPEEWTHQVHAQSNHALWFVGHIGNTDNFFVGVIAPERAVPRAGYRERFGPGSQPTNRPADYPAPDEVLAYMRERRAVLLSLLDEMDEARLETPTPKGSPEFIPDFASVFRTAGWHEGVHAGQLTVVRRALGHPPLMGAAPS